MTANINSTPQRILEGVITTLNADGTANISPMGPLVDEQFQRFLLRPYQTSTTYQNLKRSGEAVFHVTDDVELIARAAVSKLDAVPAMRLAEAVGGKILTDACRWYELRVVTLDDSEPRTEIITKVVAQGESRAFFGFNRAMHAVLEAAILATRVQLLSADEIRAAIQRLIPLIEKTGGPPERRAFAFLQQYIDAAISAPADKS